MGPAKIVFLLLDKRQRFDFIKIFIFILLMSILEIFGVALAIPAIKVLISENFNQIIILNIESKLNIKFNNIDIIIYGLIFILIYFIFKFLFSLYATYSQLSFKYKIIVKTSKILYGGYLNQDYELYTNRNSSLLVRNVTILVDKFSSLIENCFTILTDLALFFGILIFLFYLDFISTSRISLIFILLSLIYYFGTKKKFDIWGKLAVNYEFLKFKFLYEGLTSLKDIRISNNENYFLANYINYVSKHGNITLIRNFIKILPKQAYEIIAVFSLVILSFSILGQQRSIENFLPTAGVFAIAAFKILPCVNRLLLAFQNMRFDYEGLKILKNELDLIKKSDQDNQSNIVVKKISLQNKILINKVSFKYGSRKELILNDLSLEIKKNQSIGIIGESGSGKSTLMDLIIGLYKPTHGKIFCDDTDIQSNLRSWYSIVGYVPQHIHLFDNTIKMNIAFGIDENQINESRVYDCLKMSRLEKWVSSLEKGLETLVGDKGIRLSGGQRQRIGIARALYSNPKILFFDESTNSLDIQTEDELMQEVNTLLKNITKIIISHRLTTLKNCDIIYLIQDGKILDSGNYEKISKLKLSN